jgi:hypothetical protein
MYGTIHGKGSRSVLNFAGSLVVCVSALSVKITAKTAVFRIHDISVADPGCLSRIPDPHQRI